MRSNPPRNASVQGRLLPSASYADRALAAYDLNPETRTRARARLVNQKQVGRKGKRDTVHATRFKPSTKTAATKNFPVNETLDARERETSARRRI
jgi:hypothetical protein